MDSDELGQKIKDLFSKGASASKQALEKAGDKVQDFTDKSVIKIEKKKLENQVAEQKKRRAELELLQAQINPHFLYNTLDTIIWLIESGEKEKSVDMVNSLSNFFRFSLSSQSTIF